MALTERATASPRNCLRILRLICTVACCNRWHGEFTQLCDFTMLTAAMVAKMGDTGDTQPYMCSFILWKTLEDITTLTVGIAPTISTARVCNRQRGKFACSWNTTALTIGSGFRGIRAYTCSFTSQ